MDLSMKRWLEIDRLVHTIENVGSKYYKLKGTKFINTLTGHMTHEDDNFRIRALRQGELLDNIEEAGSAVKWGQYLRAPEIYFELLSNCKDKIKPTDHIAEVTRGVTTNNVNFFYLTNETINHWDIEKKYLESPVIYTPKEIPNISIDTKKLKRSLFVCNEERKKMAATKAFKYIKMGESKKIHNSLTFKGKDNWYVLGPIKKEPCSLYYARQDITYRVAYNPEGLVVNDNLYRITPRNKDDNAVLCALLNSAIFYLGLEVNGRINLGDGALKLQTYEIGNTPLLHIDNLSKTSRGTIIKAFNKLLERKIKPIFEEVKLRDRQLLDKVVLEAFGLDSKKYLKPLYDGLTEMVGERIDLAKSRRKVKQVKTQKDIEKLKEQVIEEILPDGVKKFPGEFIDSRYLKDAKEISVPDDHLQLGAYFMGQQEIITQSGFKYEAENFDEAKFIVYAQKPNSYVIKIPKKRPVVINAVESYEKYLKKLKDRLFGAIFSLTLDHKQADILVHQIYEEIGLPD